MSILVSLAAASLTLAAPAQQYAPYQGGGQERVAPRGSYAQTCSGSYTNQGRLYADCRDMRGNMRGSSIELARCSSSDIGNDDGLLVCQGVRGRWEDRGGNNGGGWGNGGNHGGNNGGGWGGGWGGSGAITVYSDANYRGASATYRSEMPNLGNTGLNDRISSIQLRGAWEVCTDAYYRGQCTVVTDDARNLDRWGLNDRISSMRPARRGGR